MKFDAVIAFGTRPVDFFPNAQMPHKLTQRRWLQPRILRREER